MNVVERGAPQAPQAVASALPQQSVAATPPNRRAKLRPLASLAPYISRYRGRAIAAVCALVVAALATLAVPIAVRRMIDFGFTGEGARLINSYFSVMIGVAGLLALASAFRFYLVTTLGERIVADLRSEVFAHITSLSAAYFDEAKTGEMVSRLTADTTQIKAAVGSSVSVALRNLVLFLGASVMMVVTSPRLSAFVLAAIPVIVLPLYGFGRTVRQRSRMAQDALAEASAYVSELIGAIRVLQAFTNEALAIGRFRAAVEHAFQTAVMSTRSRALLTAIAIFLVFASVVVVLWIGAQDVMAGAITPGGYRSSCCSRFWQRAASANYHKLAARLRRLPEPQNACSRSWRSNRPSSGPPGRSRFQSRRAARWPLRVSASPIRRGPIFASSTASRFACGGARKWH